ncbi:MAG: PEP-CTERM sorting domain-containing protein, partial [Planctomycetes bacterium]|nr:PEP-CTERM sorting domain-containing protein [Planctomycetota bacterium]
TGTRLTARLDGFSVDDVKAAINRARHPFLEMPGAGFLVDDDPDAPGFAADKMENLGNDVFAPRQIPYVYDGTDAFVMDTSGPVLGYVGHGVHGGAPPGYILDEENGLRFDIAPGAAFHTWESFNAYSFNEGGNRDGQGLVAEWIRRGGTVGVGNVEEPNVDSLSVTNEELMFQMLLDGFTWGEAAWGATFQLSYVNTVVGDPLMRFVTSQLLGDLNLDEIVNIFDFAIFVTNYGASGEVDWTDGDLDFDTDVDIFDFAILQTNFGASNAPATATPEPATLALLALGGSVMLRRRRRN